MKKIKKRKFLLIILLILCGLLLFLIFKNNNDLKVTLLDLNTEINEEKYIKDFIKSEYTITNSDEKVDTTVLGENSVIAKINEKDYSFKVNVVDTISPVITYNKTISAKENDEIDLLKNVSASDNSKEKISVNVEGNYDLSKIGAYKLYYVATDSSKNTTKEEFELNVVDDGTIITSKGYTMKNNNGVYSINSIIIVNKTYTLPSTYGNGLTTEFNVNFNKMKTEALKAGITLNIVSGFRSYTTQVGTYNYWVSQYGASEADTISARAGHSEHQLGLAADINSLSTSFKNTKEGIWLNNNAYKYGFILRYPENKSNETGYNFEPWHYRYVGATLAEKLYNNGDWITIENYYGLTSNYN